MCVARQIGEHRLWPGKGWLGVNDPVLLPQPRDEAQEDASVVQVSMIAEEGEISCGIKFQQPRQEQTAEQFG